MQIGRPIEFAARTDAPLKPARPSVRLFPTVLAVPERHQFLTELLLFINDPTPSTARRCQLGPLDDDDDDVGLADAIG